VKKDLILFFLFFRCFSLPPCKPTPNRSHVFLCVLRAWVPLNPCCFSLGGAAGLDSLIVFEWFLPGKVKPKTCLGGQTAPGSISQT